MDEILRALSAWIDAGNAHKDTEAQTWGRLSKIAEESGEVIAAYIGVTGQNPRKGVTATLEDVEAELLDVAVTALCAISHLDHVRGITEPTVEGRLMVKLDTIAERAGGFCLFCGQIGHDSDSCTGEQRERFRAHGS